MASQRFQRLPLACFLCPSCIIPHQIVIDSVEVGRDGRLDVKTPRLPQVLGTRFISSFRKLNHTKYY